MKHKYKCPECGGNFSKWVEGIILLSTIERRKCKKCGKTEIREIYIYHNQRTVAAPKGGTGETK